MAAGGPGDQNLRRELSELISLTEEFEKKSNFQIYMNKKVIPFVEY